MTSWLKGTPFNPYYEKTNASNSVPYGVDQVAAFNAFVGHWQQIVEIFDNSKKKEKVSCDDVTAVINHLGQMINFLIVDLRRMTSEPSSSMEDKNEETLISSSQTLIREEILNGGDIEPSSSHTPIFDHFVGERVLQSILQWSMTSGEFFNVLQLEQLKVYETLFSNSHPEILVYKPITEPLMTLLDSCSGCVPVEVEKRLVVLLNQLWVSLMHNQHLLKYFYLPNDNQPPKFLIFSLLLHFIHRDGGIGQQARDALLLSMSLSDNHSGIADYICYHSNFCPLLAGGLSGLYSNLPRSLNIKREGWYCISSEDVDSIPHLQMFINSLGFCNAIVQIAYPEIQKQLVDYLYQAFLVPVVGPALIQNVIDELVAAIVFMEFFLQSVTEEKLRRAFLALLLSPQEYSDLPLLISIISHLHSSNVQLNLVTLNFFNTLINLYSEDIMITLIFQYLAPCNHVMLSQRSKLSQLPFSSAERFLELLPFVCQVEMTLKTQTQDVDQDKDRPRYHSLSNSPSSFEYTEASSHPSFFLYLKEARVRIEVSHRACARWAWAYDSQRPSATEATQLISAAKVVPVVPYTKPRVHSDPSSRSLPYLVSAGPSEGAKKRSSSLPNYTKKAAAPKPPSASAPLRPGAEEEAPMDSLGESSGYESFNPKSSRDSSPLHGEASNGLAPGRGEGPRAHPEGGRSASTEKWTEFDEGFFQFLDQASAQGGSQGAEDDLQFIDHIFEEVGDSSGQRNSDMSRSDDPDSELQSPWLTASLSSAEEENDDGNKDLLTTHPKPSIGPFLEALISQIDNIFNSNTEASLLAMRCISGLASYPCPLLTSLLLQPSVVLQPAVRSLYQSLGQLKQKIDGILDSQDLPILVDARRKFYQSLSAEPVKDQTVSLSSPSSLPSQNFVRGSDKRRSFTQTVSAFFKRTPPLERNARRETLENLPDWAGFRYFNTPSPAWEPPMSPFLGASIEKRKAAICAVLLQEWLLELAALAQEHTVHSHAMNFSSLTLASDS